MAAVVLIMLVLLAAGFSLGEEGPLNLSFSKMAVFMEEPCAMAGGVCVETLDCPEDKLAKKRGLCPEQQKRGVECCYSVGRSVRDCRGRGGECSADCVATHVIAEADDCGDQQVCCALTS